jgi:hypothetical protein
MGAGQRGPADTTLLRQPGQPLEWLDGIAWWWGDQGRAVAALLDQCLEAAHRVCLSVYLSACLFVMFFSSQQAGCMLENKRPEVRTYAVPESPGAATAVNYLLHAQTFPRTPLEGLFLCVMPQRADSLRTSAETHGQD